MSDASASTQEALVPSTSAAVMGSGASAVELPSKLTVTRAPGLFELSWKWREQVSQRAFFAPVLSGLGGFAGIVNASVHWPVVGVVALGALGVVVGGTVLAYRKNVVTLRVSQGALTFTSGPIGGQNKEYVAADITDIVAVPRARRKGAREDEWAVSLLLSTRKTKMIVGYMLKQEQAEAIATLIRAELQGDPHGDRKPAA